MSEDTVLSGNEPGKTIPKTMSDSFKKVASWFSSKDLNEDLLPSSPPRLVSASKLACAGGGSRRSLFGRKHSSMEINEKISVRGGGASLRGNRHAENEDFVSIEADLITAPNDQLNESVGFAAVFDGHGGSFCSSYLKTALSSHAKRLLMQNEAGVIKKKQEWTDVASKVMSQAFEVVDAECVRLAYVRGDLSGSCAVSAFVKGSSVVIGHVGDCFALAVDITGGDIHAAGSRNGVTNISNDGSIVTRRLTKDHDAQNVSEVARVMSSGGRIANGRLEGRLQPLRSFGDHAFKSSGLISAPEICHIEMTRSQILLLCSDGISLKMADQEIGEFIQKWFKEEFDHDPAKLGSALVMHVAKALQGKDDASVLVLVFDAAEDEHEVAGATNAPRSAASAGTVN